MLPELVQVVSTIRREGLVPTLPKVQTALAHMAQAIAQAMGGGLTAPTVLKTVTDLAQHPLFRPDVRHPLLRTGTTSVTRSLETRLPSACSFELPWKTDLAKRLETLTTPSDEAQKNRQSNFWVTQHGEGYHALAVSWSLDLPKSNEDLPVCCLMVECVLAVVTPRSDGNGWLITDLKLGRSLAATKRVGPDDSTSTQYQDWGIVTGSRWDVVPRKQSCVQSASAIAVVPYLPGQPSSTTGKFQASTFSLTGGLSFASLDNSCRLPEVRGEMSTLDLVADTIAPIVTAVRPIHQHVFT